MTMIQRGNFIGVTSAVLTDKGNKQKEEKVMSTKHRFVARIDNNLWNDLKKIKKTMGNTSSINTSINESIRLFEDNMMDKMSNKEDEESP